MFGDDFRKHSRSHPSDTQHFDGLARQHLRRCRVRTNLVVAPLPGVYQDDAIASSIGTRAAADFQILARVLRKTRK